MAGRKRKAGKRQPDGRLRPSFKPTVEPMNGSLWQRILQQQKETGLDPRGVSQIGRLARAGELTIAQAVAAHRIAEIYGRYERLVGLTRVAKGFSYDAGAGGFGIAEHLKTHEQIEARERREIEAHQKWDDLQAEMGKLPRALYTAIEALCVEDQHVLPVHYAEIRLFLSRMAVLWKITNAKGKVRGAAPRAHEAITSQSQVVTKTDEPVRPKANIERIAWLKALRVLRPDLQGPELIESYELFRALKDKTSHRFKTDRAREKQGKGPAYVPPSAEITTPAAITDRPVLSLPGQEEHAA